MLSSYSRIIKATPVDGTQVISTPAVETLTEIIREKRKTHNKKNENEFFNIQTEDDIVQDKIFQADMLINDAKQQMIEADSYYREAQFKAEQLRVETEKESAELYERANTEGYNDGYRNGYQEGYDKGVNEANVEAERIITDAEIFMRSAKIEVEEYIKNTEKEILELAIEISKQIVNAEIKLNPDVILEISEKVLSKVVDRKQIIIKTNPEHFEHLKENKENLSKYVENASDLFIIADPKLSLGSVKVETPSGFVDGTLETQIDMFVRKLLLEN